MLTRRLLLSTEHLAVTEVGCAMHGRRWSRWEPVDHPALVLLRRGAFWREVDGAASVVHPGVAYLQVPGTEERFAHPHTAGDDATVIRLSPESFAELTHGMGRRPPLVAVSPAAAFQHRRLVRAAAGSRDAATMLDQAVALVEAAIRSAAPAPTGAPLPGPAVAARRRLVVDEARHLLAADPTVPLAELAGAVGVSPWHLSRSFREATGHTLTRHRQQARAHRALDLLATTDLALGAVAAACGYADQAHLTRSLRSATGHTPRQITADTRCPPHR